MTHPSHAPLLRTKGLAILALPCCSGGTVSFGGGSRGKAWLCPSEGGHPRCMAESLALSSVASQPRPEAHPHAHSWAKPPSRRGPGDLGFGRLHSLQGPCCPYPPPNPATNPLICPLLEAASHLCLRFADPGQLTYSHEEVGSNWGDPPQEAATSGAGQGVSGTLHTL